MVQYLRGLFILLFYKMDLTTKICETKGYEGDTQYYYTLLIELG